MIDLGQYKTVLFDCDGVILNSNTIKSEGFRQAALVYGNQAANELVEYNKRNGGISRWEKFKYFLERIANVSGDEGILDSLVETYASYVERKLRNCEIGCDFELLRNKYPNANWMVITGGSQDEVRRVFEYRGIADYFNLGIFGSPDSKQLILSRELAREKILFPAIYIGDSKYDHTCAVKASLDFVFVHGWTEFKDWQSYCLSNNIISIESLETLTK